MDSNKIEEGCCYNGENRTDCIRAVLHRSFRCRLGLTNGKEPYVVPLTFTYTYNEEGKNFNIYLHMHNRQSVKTPPPSRKKEFMRYHRDNDIDVCVEFDVFGSLMPGVGEAENIGCCWSVAHSSVIGYGKISKVTDNDEKNQALKRQLLRYTGKDWEIPSGALNDAEVWKIPLRGDRTTAKFRQIKFPSTKPWELEHKQRT